MNKKDWNLLTDLVAEHISILKKEMEELKDKESIADYQELIEESYQLQLDLTQHIEIISQVTHWFKFMKTNNKDGYLLMLSTPGIRQPLCENPFLTKPAKAS